MSPSQKPVAPSRTYREQCSLLLTQRFAPAVMALMFGSALIWRSIQDFSALFTLPVPINTLSDDARHIFLRSKMSYDLLLFGLVSLVLGFIVFILWMKSKYEIEIQHMKQENIKSTLSES